MMKTTVLPGQKAVQIPHYRSILGDAGDSNSVPDSDLELSGGGGGGRSSRPLDKGWGRSSKKNFSALRSSVWSTNKGGTRGSPLDPPLFSHPYAIVIRGDWL